MPEDTANANQIFLMLGRIEAKLDSYASMHDSLAQEVSILKNRLDMLEQEKAKASGVLNTVRVGLLLAGSAIGLFASQLIEFMTGR